MSGNDFEQPIIGHEENDNEDFISSSKAIKSKLHKLQKRRTRGQQAVTHLLSAFGDSVEDCSEEFFNQSIEYRDLASLNDEDLKSLGVKDSEKRSEMLETFSQLPNQESQYDKVTESTDAQKYNENILNAANSHLQSLNASLSATNLKLKIDPSRDVVVDDRNYASQFALDAIEEIAKITDEIDDRLTKLEKSTNISNKKNINYRRNTMLGTFIIGSISVCVTGAYWYWKHR